MSRKQTRTYILLVEGDCEVWYFERLVELINKCDDIDYNARIKIKQIKDRFDSYLKKIDLPALETTIYFIYDHEGREDTFKSDVLDRIKKCRGIRPGIKPFLGYTNLSFDLWMLLHKTEFNRAVIKVDDYLKCINRCFNENFESMREFKKEDNFKRCLSKIELSDTKNAILLSKKIMDDMKYNGNKLKEYKSFTYYNENPSLSVHKVVDEILKECGIK